MTKQEFLAMSLPYGVKVLIDDELSEISAIGNSQYQILGRTFAYGWYGDICNCKPVLHPLSDLTKPIEHKGEKFVPIIELIKIKYSILLDLQDEDFSIYTDGYPRACYTTNAIWEIMINPDYLPNEEFWIIQKLIEWHFNLMDIGEKFIDVNTLEENPYK